MPRIVQSRNIRNNYRLLLFQSPHIKMSALRAFKWIGGILIFGGFLYVTATGSDPDLFWHLRVGQWVVEHGDVPHADEYSHTMAGHEWVDHEWAQEALLWKAHAGGWWPAVILSFSFIAFFPFAVWLKRAEGFAYAFAVILASAVALRFIGVRPQTVSFSLFFILYELLRLRDAAGGRKRVFLSASLPLFFLIWANLHAGFAGGLVLFAAFIAGRALDGGVRRFSFSGRGLQETALFLICAAAPLLNPYGAGLYKEVLAVGSSSLTARYVQEWGSSLIFPDAAIALLLGSFLFLLIEFRLQYPRRLLVPSVVFLLMFLKSLRMGPLFLVAAMPVFFKGCENIAHRAGEAIRLRGVRYARATVALGLAAWFGVSVAAHRPVPFPEAAVSFLNNRAGSGERIVLFNDYGWGGYLIMHAPLVPVFVDGRMPHWADETGASAMQDYLSVALDKEKDAWRGVFSRRGVNTVLIKRKEQQAEEQNALLALAVRIAGKSTAVRNIAAELTRGGARDLETLLHEEGWKTVWEDDVAVLLAAPAR
jgi:hypothetical protein